MSRPGLVAVVGMGEVGEPLHRILSLTYKCVAIDLEPKELNQPCSVLHICYPFQIRDFITTTCAYIAKYRPELVIINSTVLPGTTREICKRSAVQTAYSPVRGKHANMEEHMRRYHKFVAGCSNDTTRAAVRHFAEAGFATSVFSTPEIGELSKLLETTWLGILVGWAQEVERFAMQYGATYDEVNTFIREIDFLPSHVLPGFIGGHCVMPNIKLLQTIFHSPFLDAIVDSNSRVKQRAA